MKNVKLMLVILVVVVSMVAQLWAQAESVRGYISEVTVYRGQALVTRQINVETPAGSRELIVTDLPHRIVPESLFAQADGKVTILSVRYREGAVKEDTREEVKQLDAQIDEMKRHINHLDRDRQHISTIWKRYDPFWKVTVDTANSDLDRGLLQFEPIEKLTGYLEEKFNKMHDDALDMEDNLVKLRKDLELLERKKGDLVAGRSKTQREAVIFIDKKDKNKAVLSLNYLVGGANWEPQYNLRAQQDKEQVTVEYNAIIHQASGEAWNSVALSLSTAQPTMVASPPILEPMRVSVAAGPGETLGQNIYRNISKTNKPQQEQYRDLSGQFSELQQNRRKVAREGKRANFRLNELALGSQMMELKANKDAVRIMQKQAKKISRNEGVSVTYNLPGKLSMPSRSDQQLVTIAAFNAKSKFVMLASPLLTDYVYLQGEIVNDSDSILLPGPSSMYRNGEFVGKGQMELVTIGEKFTAGFGVDSQIQISREFKDKKVDTLWGNRVEKYDYRIAISNYKNSKVKLRLLERIPYSEDEALEISEFQTNMSLSKDAEYLRTQREKGLLRWDLTLEPNTKEQNAKVVTYRYTMKYDKDMHIQ